MPGAQEQSPYNGHFESVRHHPLFLFNQGADRLAATLQPGTVKAANKDVLLSALDQYFRGG